MNIVQLLKPALEIMGGKLPADLLSGKPFNAIIVSVDGNRIRLDAGQGRTITAETDTPVKVGDSVRVVLQPPGLSGSNSPAGQDARPRLPPDVPPGQPGGQTARSASPSMGREASTAPSAPSTSGPSSENQPFSSPAGPPNGITRGAMAEVPATIHQKMSDQLKTSSQTSPPLPSRPTAEEAGASVNLQRPGYPQALPPPLTKDPALILKPLLTGGLQASSREFQLLAEQVETLAARLQQPSEGPLNLPPSRVQETVGQLIQIGRELKHRILSMPDTPSLTEAEIRSRIENSGMFLESRLASGKDVSGDLKGILLRLERALIPLAGQDDQNAQAPQPSRTDHPAGLAGRILTQTRMEIMDIESHQAAHVITQSGTETPSITVPLSGEFRHSSLTITQEEGRPKSGKASRNRHRVVMRLDMSALGAVRVDALSGEGGIAIGFVVEDEDALRRVRSELEYLRARLEEKGCPVAELIARQGEVKVEIEPPPVQGQRYSRKA